MNIDGIMTLDRNQAMIVFGYPTKTIKAGVRAPWASTEVEVVGVSDNGVQIKRVAFDSAVSTAPDAMPQSPDQSHPLDAFNNGAAEGVDGGVAPGVTIVMIKKPLGVEKKVLQPGQAPGGEIVEKVDALGPELKTPHPEGYFTNAPVVASKQRKFDEAVEILNALKAARTHDGVKDEPLMAASKEMT